MQRRIPIGYEIVDGKAVLVQEQADLIRKIFVEYQGGASTYQISKELIEQGVLNANGICSWNHGSVGNMLENRKYPGDDFYPAIIEPELFEQVQKRRAEQCRRLGRNKQLNHGKQKSVFADRLVCGICGSSYQRYVEHTRNPVKKIQWKCRQSMRHNKGTCESPCLEDWQIRRAFVSTANQMISGMVHWRRKLVPREGIQTIRVRELTERMQEMDTSPDYTADEMVRLSFERARVQYDTSVIDAGWYQAGKMEEAISDRALLEEFEESLFAAIVRRVIIAGDGALNFQFINGFERLVPSKCYREEEQMCRQ